MTIFDHTSHKALWDYLANPENDCDDKGWAIDELELLCPEYSDYYACDYAANEYIDRENEPRFNMLNDNRGVACICCPLEWPDNQPCKGRGNMQSLYVRFLFAKEDDKCKLAAQIRDLPVKQGVQTK